MFDAERRLWQSLNSAGIAITTFSLMDDFSAQDAGAWSPIVPECFPPNWPEALGRSPQLRTRLLAEPADLLYRAGLWKWTSHNSREWCRQHKKAEIIAPHGMLDPWAVKNSGLKKRLALMLYERQHLKNATCIRALCESEADSIRAFGLKNPICIIPNGIDVPEIRKPEIDIRNQKSRKRTLLYLGRIHPKKGLVNLLRAWKQSLDSQPAISDWLLAIAGWDQGGHEAELKTLCSELKVESSVQFLGPNFGEDKASLYRNCDAFILPSVSEGLPMVILEAWAYGKPVLMTPECNLPEGFVANAAIRIETNIESIARGLDDLFRSPASVLRTLGDNGRLVAARFIWSKIADDMKQVYDWVLGGGMRPNCVKIN